MRRRIFAHRNAISRMLILSPSRVSAFLHSQDPKRNLSRIICCGAQSSDSTDQRGASLMRHKDRPSGGVFQNIACRTPQQHLAQSAVGVGAHHKQTGIVFCRRHEQRIADRPQFGRNNLPSRVDVVATQVDQGLRLRGAAGRCVFVHADDANGCGELQEWDSRRNRVPAFRALVQAIIAVSVSLVFSRDGASSTGRRLCSSDCSARS